MKIELITKSEIDNKTGEEKIIETKTFHSVRPRGRAMQRTLSISKSISEVGENFTEEHYILMCEYIREAFGNQFTTDELMDGLYQDQIFSTFQEVVQEVTDRINGKMVNVAKN